VPAALALALIRHWQAASGMDAERLAALLREARGLLADMGTHTELPAEALLASGTLRYLTGDPVGAARALRHAVAVAPSLAQANEMLGVLLLDADLAQDGEPRIATAQTLAPELLAGRAATLRYLALAGDWKRHDDALDALARQPGTRAAVWKWRFRTAMWRRDRDTMAALAEALGAAGGINADDAEWQGLDLLARAAIHGSRPAPWQVGDGRCAADLADSLQVRAELRALHGDTDGAFEAVAAAVGLGFAGLAWMRRCPLLDGLRTQAAWQPLLERIERRSTAILDAMHSEWGQR